MSEQLNPEAEDVLLQIAYLDDDVPGGPAHQQEFLEVMKAIAQLEIAKQSHWPNANNVALRLQSLEGQMEVMRRMMLARPRPIPIVQYVTAAQEETESIPHRSLSFPKSLVVFYSLGLVCSILFAILLALSAVGVNSIHPFLELLGFVGGIGWLTTAWTDLLLLKAGKSWHLMTVTPTSSKSSEQEKVMAMTGRR